MSAYGPGKNPPASLLESNEYSPEEIRVRFYELASKGRQDEADQEASALWNKAQQAMNGVKNDADSVRKFMEEASKKEPNRYTLLKMDGTKPRDQLFAPQSSTSAFSAQPSNPFGSTPASSAFGGASSSTNPFSKPPASTFGQPSSGPSPFGGSASQPTSTFGQPSFGSQSNASPFGQPSQPSAFGKPAFGQPAAATASQQPAFGKPAFGQPANTTSQQSGFGTSFGQPAQSGQSSAFGSNTGAFASGVFGSPAPAFGSGSGTGVFGSKPNNAPANPFGAQPSAPVSKEAEMDTSRPASRANPFGANPTVSATPAAPSGFGQAAPAKSPLGNFGQQVFGSSGQGGETQVNAFADPSVTKPFGQPRPQERVKKAPLTYTQTLPNVAPTYDQSNRLTTYRGQRVQYVQDPPKIIDGEEQAPTYFPCYVRPDGKGLEKIWFLEGNESASVVAIDNHKQGFEAPEEAYTEEVKESYRVLHETGDWKDGKMPSVAPRREFVDCDF